MTTQTIEVTRAESLTKPFSGDTAESLESRVCDLGIMTVEGIASRIDKVRDRFVIMNNRIGNAAVMIIDLVLPGRISNLLSEEIRPIKTN